MYRDSLPNGNCMFSLQGGRIQPKCKGKEMHDTELKKQCQKLFKLILRRKENKLKWNKMNTFN